MASPTQTRAAYHPKAGAGYQSLAFKDVDLPALKSSEVLVKIHAVSLNFRDLMISAGKYPIGLKDGTVPCSDMAGEVLAIGDEVTEWKTGDRVCANFAPEHLHGDVTAKSSSSALGAGGRWRSDAVQNFQGIFLGCNSRASILRRGGYSALRRRDRLQRSHQSGPYQSWRYSTYSGNWRRFDVRACLDSAQSYGSDHRRASFALQFAVASGATVIVTSSSDDKLAIAKKLGAHHFINYAKTPEWHAEVLRITHGRGVDYTIEVGGPGTLAKSLQATRRSGFISIIGALDVRDSGSENSSVIFSAIHRQLNLRGIQVGSVESFKNMNRLMVSRPEITRPVIDKVYAFEDSAKAFEHLESQRHVGKVVINVL
ncbi:hypothetical protein PM082_019813 [Marasmius tenuissimus]|nr:hypothetical protein PM082_019813 [Marasmius tenuissimus]